MCLYTTPRPQILQWDGWVSPAHSSSALSATLATVFISANSHTDKWRPSFFSALPLPSFSRPRVFLVPFLFLPLAPRCPTCFPCTTDGVHACGSSRKLSHLSTFHFSSSYYCSSSPPPCSTLHLSLLCTIGTGVAPSEWAVKMPYKKPQHTEERVMMKFNCSFWCTWGLALCVCRYTSMCRAYVSVCLVSTRPGYWTGTGLLGGSMSRHRHESYRFLKMRYRFCGELIYTGIKLKAAGEV